MHQDESFCWAISMPQTDDSPSRRAESDSTLCTITCGYSAISRSNNEAITSSSGASIYDGYLR